MIQKQKIAVIGAGLSGILVAKQLAEHNQVVVFEKSRGFGGRMTTRRHEDYQFDHGAKYFKVSSPEFSNFLRPYIEKNIITPWRPKLVAIQKDKPIKEVERPPHFSPYYIAQPKMSSLCRKIAEENHLDVRLQHKVIHIQKAPDGWELEIMNSEMVCAKSEKFDWVISCIPSEQATALMPEEFIYHQKIRQYKMLPCFVLLLGFAQSPNIPWEAANVYDYNIRWIAVNNSKPGRPNSYSLSANSSNEWAIEHLEEDFDIVQTKLMTELSEIIDIDVRAAEYQAVHRWRYANIEKQTGSRAYIDSQNQLAACGDWCVEGRVEGAFLSAREFL